MDIRDWPLDRIMQLPDHCFGRRWPIITSRVIAGTAVDEWLVEAPLPDKCILWSTLVQFISEAFTDNYFKLALGDHEPANDAEFDAFERVVSGDYENATDEGAVYVIVNILMGFSCRLPLFPQGRRFAIQASNAHPVTPGYFTAIFIVSSIPTEVPDCLLSV